MQTSRYWRPVLLIMVPALLFLVVLQTPVEPWGDEAMLLANLLEPNIDLLQPLPYYEQAAPPGYLWLARTILYVFGDAPPFHALRLLSAAFFAGGICLILGTEPLRRDWKASTILVALLLGSPLVWGYAGEMKPYSADFFASAMILASGLPLARGDNPRRLAVFFLTVLVGGLLSFTIPIVVAGVLAGLALQRLPNGGVSAPPRMSMPFVLTGGAALLYLVGVYLLVNRGLVLFQLSAYSHVYLGNTAQGIARVMVSRLTEVLDIIVNSLGADWFAVLRRMVNQAGAPLGIAYHTIRLIALALLGLIVWLAVRRSPVVVLISLCLFAVVAALQMVGALNLVYERHVIFLLPVSATLSAIAVSVFVDRCLPAAGRGPVTLLAMLACLTVGLVAGLGRQTQNVSELLSLIKATAPEVPVWVHGNGQHVVAVLKPQPARVLGELDRASGTTAWAVRGGLYLDPARNGGAALRDPDYPGTIADVAATEDSLWLLFASNASVPDHTPFLRSAESTVGPCRPEMQNDKTSLYFCQSEQGE